MKNTLQLEIETLAEKILITSKLNDVSALRTLTKELYDKLTVLEYITQNETTIIPVTTTDTTEVNDEDKELISTLNEDLFVSNEPMDDILIEPATEKMIDIVAQMDFDAQQVDDLLENVMDAPVKNDMVNVTPTLEDINTTTEVQKKSLNDRLKQSITIGLNDRIAFVKHLFNGSTEDFNRVVSQLNTLSSELEALEFLNNMVKPEYNNWVGKEAYESRFLSFIEGKF